MTHKEDPRSNTTWTEDEEKLLLKMSEKGMSREDIALALRRTVPGVRNRLSHIRRGKKKYPHKPKVKEPPKEEGELDLMLWFVKEAWLEGHAISIPALGATFQKGSAE